MDEPLGVIISATFKNLVFNYFLNIVREVNMAATYAIEFKKEIIRKYVLSKRDGSFTNLSSFLKVNALSLSSASFYTWRKKYLDEVAEEEGLSENEKQGVYGTKANEMSLARKFKIIMETSKLSEEDFGAYCRSKGLYAQDVENWKQELSDFLDSDFLDENAAKQLRSEIKDTRSQLDKALKEAACKDKEIISKDHALATYAAKVVAMRNFQKLFADDAN